MKKVGMAVIKSTEKKRVVVMEADTRIVIAQLHKINVHCRDVSLYHLPSLPPLFPCFLLRPSLPFSSISKLDCVVFLVKLFK